MVFEVELFVKEAALDTANYVTPISEDQRINFVTYDTLFKRDDCDVPALPLTLAGSIGLLDEQIVVSGVAPNARYELGEIFRGAFIGDLNISFSTIVRKDAEQPVEPSLALSGTLVVPECGSYFCRLDRAVMYRHFESMTVELAEVHLTDLVTLTNSLAWSSAKCPVISWARRIPMFFSVEIQINPSELRSVGCGTVKFGGSQGDVKVVMSPQGFGAVAKLSNVRTGGICLHG
ncbi:unnamed protein product [Trypanosoma congolense IL3000]|uniref:WGS project CAEQ00000000 data, annotated contig 2268 n=1 Tax=Trypanosoma congolense (strain IL3000) TaxID=1068625 RepID=F9WCT9_TRYCI|nr:unnamed protein product [Trypanosoma congolense IL3000]